MDRIALLALTILLAGIAFLRFVDGVQPPHPPRAWADAGSAATADRLPAPPSHAGGSDWMAYHGSWVVRFESRPGSLAPAYCRQCHAAAACQNCHQYVGGPRL
jgi:hypothetical protein